MPLPVSLPTWSQTKTTSKAGFDRVYRVVDKLGAPVNRLSNKLGSEAFWPTTLDKESDKAARILRSFCKDGFYVEEKKTIEDGLNAPNGELVDEKGNRSVKEGVTRGKQRVIKKIPTEVIKKAKGLAIFTTMRTGLWVSGAGGSGVLLARMADGTWSPPSGIMLHTAGLGFLVGVDIYDCVVVINTEKALEAFTKIRCTLGGEVSAVAGPVGMGGVLETEVHKRQAPVWNYLKSRGFYAGVQIDGTVIIERTDENERFYGERIPVADILAGKARRPPKEIAGLINTIKAAQGDTDIDESAIPSAEPTPGDYEVKDDDSGFGLPPDEDDPDPFGVHALQEQGMEVREAGTGSRPSMDAFKYQPSPSSPIYATFHSRKNSKRDSSRMSITSIHTDRGTQTDDLPSPRFSDSPHHHHMDSPVNKISENLAEEPDEGDSDTQAHEHEPEPEIVHQTVQTIQKPAAATVVSTKPKLVNIPKRVPPALPPRNPHRTSGGIGSALASPASPSFSQQHHQAAGLGIEMNADTPSPRMEDVDLSKMPSHQSIEERIQQLHLAPSRDSSRLSAQRSISKDDLGDASGSDYSRPVSLAPTPAEGLTKVASRGDDDVEEPSQNTITLMDEETKQDSQPKDQDTPLPPDSHVGVFEGDRSKVEQEKEKDKVEDDDFHSVPQTPIDGGEQMFTANQKEHEIKPEGGKQEMEEYNKSVDPKHDEKAAERKDGVDDFS